MILTTIVAVVAAQLYDTFIEKGKEFFIDKGMSGVWDFLSNNKETFKSELTIVINDTMASYKALHHIENDNTLRFYAAETVMQELLTFSFTGDIDIDKIQKAIEDDTRIVVPAHGEIEEFLKIFKEKIEASNQLKSLYIRENYQSEVFITSQKISELGTRLELQIRDLQERLSKLVNNNLSTEWNRQLDEIKEEYKLLKHNTARKRVIALRERMQENGLSDPFMKAKTISILTDCSTSPSDNSESEEINRLHIQAYQLVPSSNSYKEKAAMAYLLLQDTQTANNLVNELLNVDANNLVAWVILASINNLKLEYLETQVPTVVRNDKAFQLNIVYRKISEHQFEDISTLIAKGYNFLDIVENEPEKVSYRNLAYWATWATTAIVIYFSGKKEFASANIAQDAYDLPKLTRITSVIGKILQTVKGTEIEKDFSFLKFQYHYSLLIENFNDSDLQQLKESHDALKQGELSYTVTFQLLRALASSKNEDNINLAFDIIDRYPQKDIGLFIIFKINHYLSNDKGGQAASLVGDYYNSIEELDELNIANVLQLLALHYEINPVEALLKARELANKISSKNPAFNKLLLVQADILEKTKEFSLLKPVLNELESELSQEPDYVKNYLANTYVIAGEFMEAERVLSSYADRGKLNESTLLLCGVLFDIPAKRLELQNMLKNFREKDVFLPQRLLEYDRKMAKAQYNYKLLVEICDYGLKYYPYAPVLIYDLMISLDHLKDRDNIEKRSYLLEDLEYFGNEGFLIHMCEVLFKNGFDLRALEILYKNALDKRNTKIRDYYISKLLTNPQIAFPSSEAVEVGNKVVYTIDGRIHEIEITNDNVETNVVRQLLGKRITQEFVFTSTNNKIYKIEIKEIVDKFRTLLRSLMKETENPMSGFSVQQFSIDEQSSVPGFEQIIDQLKENFGPQEEIRRQQIQSQLDQYYSGELTFTVLARGVFRENAIDAYLYFTSDQGRFFRIPPAFFYTNVALAKTDAFVLDIPSLLFLFQLEADHDLKVDDCKFLIANTTYRWLENIIADVRSGLSSIGQLQLTGTGAKGVLYGDDYTKQRVEYFESIMNWVEIHCEVNDVPERLEFLPDLDADLLDDVCIQSILDNLILSRRPGHLLITSDMSFFTILHGDREKIISVEFFLKMFMSHRYFESIQPILIKKNIVGISVDEKVLKEEFINRQAGKSNNYSVCLENLSVSWNSIQNIQASISHIKWLLTEAVLMDNLRLLYAEEVFRSLIPGLIENKDAQKLIAAEIRQHFALLGENLGFIVVRCMQNAIRYMQS